MSSTSSYDDSITLSEASVKDEVISVGKIVRGERSKDAITIAVASVYSLSRLRKTCKYRKGFFELGEAPVTLLTTVDQIQATIDRITLHEDRRILNLLVSTEIHAISFDVPSHFRKLKVLRCASKEDKGTLLVDGLSTFNNIRVDQWQADQHKDHRLIIGYQRGVRIRLADFSSFDTWNRSRSSFTNAERDELYHHFHDMASTNRWDEIKGAVASVMGIAIGAGSLALNMSGAAGGLYVRYAFGLHALELGVGGLAVKTVATAAGSAVVLGVAAGVAIYFIPWDGLFQWLKGAFSWLWEKIYHLWEKFTSWVKSFFMGIASDDTCDGPLRSMPFAA